MYKIFLPLTALAAFTFAASPAQEASAQGIHINAGGLHVDVGNPHRGYYGNRTALGGFYGYGYRAGYGYRSYRPRRAYYHDTSHVDYIPGHYVPHGNHIDYVPGRAVWHSEGHWDVGRGYRGRHGRH